MKIRELEMKLQEEEHQRKLIQNKAKQVIGHHHLIFLKELLKIFSLCTMYCCWCLLWLKQEVTYNNNFVC